MAMLNVTQLSQLLTRQTGTERSQTGGGRASAGEPGRGPRPLRPEDLHHEPKLRPEMLAGFHGLGRAEARASVAEVSEQVSQMTPWRAAELQAVADPGLLPSAYV
jgi:hypothetical protein